MVKNFACCQRFTGEHDIVGIEQVSGRQLIFRCKKVVFQLVSFVEPKKLA